MFSERTLPGMLFALAAACTSGGEAGSAKARTGSAAGTPSPGVAIPERKCPVTIAPGRRFGPIALGATREQLKGQGLRLVSIGVYDETELVDIGPYRVELCAGTVNEVWVADLKRAPDCVVYDSKEVDRGIGYEDFTALFTDCRVRPNTGGLLTECNDGGVRIESGMGEYLQVRVGRFGTVMDDDCGGMLDEADDDHRPRPPCQRERAELGPSDLVFDGTPVQELRNQLSVRRSGSIEWDPAQKLPETERPADSRFVAQLTPGAIWAEDPIPSDTSPSCQRTLFVELTIVLEPGGAQPTELRTEGQFWNHADLDLSIPVASETMQSLGARTWGSSVFSLSFVPADGGMSGMLEDQENPANVAAVSFSRK